MPKDKSIKSVLLIGSGPIIIGQACEPACRQAGSITPALPPLFISYDAEGQ
jgi:hypothetical protein